MFLYNKTNQTFFIMVSIYNRESYITASKGDILEGEIDYDCSEEHLLKVIQTYKLVLHLHVLSQAMFGQGELTQEYYIAKRGLEIEEELLKNIKEINNNAKSARVKK